MSQQNQQYTQGSRNGGGLYQTPQRQIQQQQYSSSSGGQRNNYSAQSQYSGIAAQQQYTMQDPSVMTFATKNNPQQPHLYGNTYLQQQQQQFNINNSVIQEAQSSQMEQSSRMYTSRRTTIMEVNKDIEFLEQRQLKKAMQQNKVNQDMQRDIQKGQAVDKRQHQQAQQIMNARGNNQKTKRSRDREEALGGGAFQSQSQNQLMSNSSAQGLTIPRLNFLNLGSQGLKGQGMSQQQYQSITSSQNNFKQSMQSQMYGQKTGFDSHRAMVEKSNFNSNNPLKSTTSAKTIISNGQLRSARMRGHQADSEMTHTDFTETQNDEDDHDFNQGGFGGLSAAVSVGGGLGLGGAMLDGNDSGTDQSSQDMDDTTYTNITHHHINLGEQYSNQSTGPNQFQHLWGHYVLFLDPESFIYYRKDLKRDDYIVLEPLIDEGLREKFQQANKIHLYKIRKLLVLEGFSWNFKGEADLYRRRQFPRQFLQNEASDYPCYVFQSELSKAFNHKGEIEAVIDLMEYKTQMYYESGGQINMDEDFVISFNESLVNSTKEFIKNILRKVYAKFKFKIKPRPHHQLILKADGYREYFEGNYQLLQYERVRACLRKNEKMRLILTEIPVNYRDKRFPPIFRISHEVPPANQVSQFQQQQQQQLQFTPPANQINFGEDQGAAQMKSQAHLQLHNNNEDDNFNFNFISNSSPYFWYPPVQNIRLHYEKMMNKRQQPTGGGGMSAYNFGLGGASSSVGGGGNGGSSMMLNAFNQQQDKFMRKVVYVAPEKDKVSLTEHRHLTGGTALSKANEQIILLSGECNWRFKFRLVGIERLNVLFNEIKQRVATENLNTEPRNVTLKPSKLLYRKQQTVSGTKPDSNTGDGYGSVQNSSTVISGNEFAGTTSSSTGHSGSERSMLGESSSRSSSRKGQGVNGNFLKWFKRNAKALEKQEEEKRQAMAQKKLKAEEDVNANLAKSDVLPYLLKKTMKAYQQAREKEEKERGKSKGKDKKGEEGAEFQFKKKKGKHGHEVKHTFTEEEEQYLSKELAKIDTPYCNFSNNFETINHYQNILSSTYPRVTPLRLIVECTLFHGCETLTQTVYSEEAYFNNTVRYNQWINFGNLRYCQIPMKTRLSFNIILLTKEGHQLTIGCVSINLFDEKGRFRTGLRELNVWPFYELDERLGCMKEYNGMTVGQAQAKDFHKMIDSLFSKLVIEFENFNFPFYYSSRDEKKIDFHKLSTNKEDRDDKTNLINVQVKNQDLAKLKRYLNQNPLTKFDDTIKRDLFKCREHYQTHPQGLPIFLRSVQWNRPIQVNEVYKMLQNWAPMKPEEAISLLDAKFPDERVRQYAVARISQLSDDDLALYMLQFAQALLFEEQHLSPLAEMLIERSLRNPYVVGHAFYWSLKSNLYLKPSYERYYVLLEQFLMLCGKFKEEIWIQQKVNTSLKAVSENVVHNRYKDKIPFSDVKERARFDLREQRKKLPFLFTMTIDPKIIVKDFIYEKMTVFSSKKVPLFVTCSNQQPGGDPMTALFKNGDDLRQDILTLQIIYIMDKIWLANNLDLAMTPYKVVGTDCEQGHIEFVGNCKTLAYIQYKRSVFNTFSDDTIERYMEHYLKKRYPKEWEERLRRNRDRFISSTAGYCVASYVLGLGDRHPDNIMVNREEGNFLHIDFGHFLGNVKKKFGVKRERDPFVFSKEIAYFVNGGPLNRKQAKVRLRKQLTEEELRDLSETALSIDDDVLSVGSKGSDIDESMKSRSFKQFEDKCCQAYNILRKEGHQLINMFLIMLSAGMPELKKDDDIQFMVNRLDLGISEQEASNKFKKEIQRAMQTYSRRFDNFLHNIKAKYL